MKTRSDARADQYQREVEEASSRIVEGLPNWFNEIVEVIVNMGLRPIRVEGMACRTGSN
jgi:hypothetical protein